MVNAYIDRQTETIDGVTFQNTHSGQKRAYGDSFYEYQVRSDLPAAEVERICSEKVYKAMPESQWRAEQKSGDAAAYFRAHYQFQQRGDGKYFYSVCFPYTD